MGINNTISFYFFRWIVEIIVVGILVLALNLVMLTYGMNNNILIPANQPIKQGEKIKKQIEQSTNINPNLISSDLDYAIFNKNNNELVKSNLSSINIKKAKEAFSSSVSKESVHYLRYDSKNEALLIRYTLKVEFANPDLRNLIPNPLIIMWITSFILYFIYIVLKIKKFRNKIVLENEKLIYVAKQIKKRDLNIEYPSVKFSEYKDVMETMKSLSMALSVSIQNEIEGQRTKAEQISYLVHDIKIPLTVIKGNIELMELLSENDMEENFTDIMNAIRQIEAYIQQVIDLNLNSKETILNKQEVSIAEFLNIVEDEVRILGNINNVVIEDKTIKKTKIFLDIKVIIRAINNILINGIERTPKDKLVKLTVKQENKNIQFIIVDGGEGFSEEALKKGTELFYTENQGRTNNKHYGLGLTFAERVIKQHNGTVVLSNNKDKSGKVTINLPLNSKVS
ncbi:sensor histidine kinase [Priestia aryabhattai]|uniref:sensor histidine kinase n=1 Tax=Priestia aryabhattai TaxID=412384 RepID=UPI0027E4F5D9|nr:HAMP domain-containing sensor histidine kinase [Priestia aryabhattai]WJX02684.1 HAMP domain-containing sensor histidine kinase [Priestia aryabhattai]